MGLKNMTAAEGSTKTIATIKMSKSCSDVSKDSDSIDDDYDLLYGSTKTMRSLAPEKEERKRVSLKQPAYERVTYLLRLGWDHAMGLYFEPKELHDLLEEAKVSLMSRCVLDEVTGPVVIIGDVHGCYQTVFDILELFGWPGMTNHLFLGDYVDRGEHSIEVITLLLCAQILYPDNFHLIRGNHETKPVNSVHGFKAELVRVYEEKVGMELWEHFNDTFACMPISGLVNGRVLCMHGGLSPHLSSLDDIRAIERPLIPNPKTSQLAHDLMWSDPAKEHCSSHVKRGNEPQQATNKPKKMGFPWRKEANAESAESGEHFSRNEKRCTSWKFDKTAVRETMKRLKLDMVIRGHEVQPFGYSFFAKKRLLTIFSQPNYGKSYNYGAIAIIDEKNNLTVQRSFAVTGHEVNGFKTLSNRKEEPRAFYALCRQTIVAVTCRPIQ